MRSWAEMHHISSHKLAPAHQRMGYTCGQGEEGQWDGQRGHALLRGACQMTVWGSAAFYVTVGVRLPVNLTSQDLCLCGPLPLGWARDLLPAAECSRCDAMQVPRLSLKAPGSCCIGACGDPGCFQGSPAPLLQQTIWRGHTGERGPDNRWWETNEATRWRIAGAPDLPPPESHLPRHHAGEWRACLEWPWYVLSEFLTHIIVRKQSFVLSH